jgi:hypothetical protein
LHRNQRKGSNIARRNSQTGDIGVEKQVVGWQSGETIVRAPKVPPGQRLFWGGMVWRNSERVPAFAL